MRSVSARLIPMRHKLRLRLLWKCQKHLIWFFSVRSSSSTLSSSQMTELFSLCLRLTQTHYRGSSFLCLYTWSFPLDHYPQLVGICEWMNTGDCCSPSALFFHHSRSWMHQSANHPLHSYPTIPPTQDIQTQTCPPQWITTISHFRVIPGGCCWGFLTLVGSPKQNWFCLRV